MIRDTAATDVLIQPAARRLPWKWIGLGVALLVVLALSFPALQRWGSAQQSVSAQRLRIAEVARGPFVSDLSVQGRVVAAVAPTLYAPAAGVVTLLVQAGDKVAKDQVLARIDSPDLKNELERESANLEGQRSAFARQRIEADTSRAAYKQSLELARVEVEAAAREHQRAREAHELGVVPANEVDRRADQFATARVRYEHAQQETRLRTESLGLDLRTRELDLDRQALVLANLKRRVDELSVRAPVAGVVGAVPVAQKAAVAPNTPLVTVVDLSALEVEVQIPESYADSLGLGMPAEVRVGSAPVGGKLSAISPDVQNGLVSGRVRFEGTAPAELRQNQRVTTRIVLEQRDGVLAVQRGPFLDAGGGRYAYVVRDELAVRVPIKVGSSSVDKVEIVEGLNPGDRIVISGTDAFGDAETVYIRD